MVEHRKTKRPALILAGIAVGLQLLLGPVLVLAAPGQLSGVRQLVATSTPVVTITPVATITPAVTITPEAALVRVLAASHLQAGWFAPAFLTQVRLAQVQQVIAALEAQLGRYRKTAARSDGSYRVSFAHGTVQARIHLDDQGRIDGLLFTNVRLTYLSRSAALAGLKSLPGHVSVLVLANDVPHVAVSPDASLAVGSTFKLAVMAGLKQRIAAHQLSWQQQIALKASDKSLPSGILQTKPVGSRYTISAVARYMISISDNTAANMLIRVVGRSAIDPLIPRRDRPLLTTRELFILKAPANHDLAVRFIAASTPSRRLAVLNAVDRRPLPSPRVLNRLLARGPVVPQIEYFFTVRQLCGLMGQVSEAPQMTVNPGVAARSDWAHVAYKGGSEAGVINLTTMATSHSGRTYCVSATWNNTTNLDEGRFEQLYSSLLHSFH